MLDSYLIAKASKDHLAAARMATLMHEATSPEAIALRDEILPMLNWSKAPQSGDSRRRAPQPKELMTQRETLDAILADLIVASAHVEALGYFYRGSKRQEFTDSGTKASSRAYEWQMNTLDALGLVDRKIGISAKEDFDGHDFISYRRATRVRATPRLLAITKRHGITSDNVNEHYIKHVMKSFAPIVLRASKSTVRGKALSCPDTEQVRHLQDQVQQVNAVYARHTFDGIPTPCVYRIFNCADSDHYGFDKGGRIYADFQSMSQESRKRLRIDGKPAVELDLKASQLTILYGITGTEMSEGDPYHIEGLPRAVVKAAITTMIGLGHTKLSRWPAGSAERLNSELQAGNDNTRTTFSKSYPIKATAAKVLQRHPVLYHLKPGQMDWADLQFIESEVLIATILRLGREHDVPALPLHDSIIVAEDQAGLGCRILSEVFQHRVGRRAVIIRKG